MSFDIKFLFRLLGLTVFLAGIIMVVSGLWPGIVHKTIYIQLVFHAGLAIVAYRIGKKAVKVKDETSAWFLMIPNILRIFLSGAFVVYFVQKGLDNRITFTLNFFILYLFYTAFDIIVLMANLRLENKG